MTVPFDIRPQDLAAVRSVLTAHLPPACRVWVFGSRANGRAWRGSDLDLAVDAGRVLTQDETAALKEAFDDSDLPYAVDVVDWRAASTAFRAAVEMHPMVLCVG